MGIYNGKHVFYNYQQYRINDEHCFARINNLSKSKIPTFIIFIYVKMTFRVSSLKTKITMILSTTENIPNKEVIEIIGLVKGNSVRARNIGRDVFALMKNVIGGEIVAYTKLLDQSREQAIERLITEAKNKNADAVVNIRFTTSMIVETTSEILAYGTAVKLKDK